MDKESSTMYNKIAKRETLEKTKLSLEQNGFSVFITENSEAAKAKALTLIPEGAEVMTMTSDTLDTTGIAQHFNESGKYDSVKTKLIQMDRSTQNREMQKIGAAPEYAIGSVHAITEDGKVFIASNTGSQIPSYVFGSSKVVWIVGAQKITKNEEEARQRIFEYVLPLESERAHKAYGVPGSEVKKLLSFYKEFPGRVNIILVNEALGF